MKVIITWLKWLYWSGRYTRVDLWQTDSIGYHQGYYECKSEHLDILGRYHADCKEMHYKKAGELLDERHEKMRKKYFGPKYIKSK